MAADPDGLEGSYGDYARRDRINVVQVKSQWDALVCLARSIRQGNGSCVAGTAQAGRLPASEQIRLGLRELERIDRTQSMLEMVTKS